MTTLYSCRTISPVEFRMTKFDHHHNVLSSYTLTQEGCDCPQSHKPTCRHRKMLPTFAKAGHIDDGFFLDWDTRMWHKPLNEPAEEPSPSSAVEEEAALPPSSEAKVEQKVPASAPLASPLARPNGPILPTRRRLV